MKIIIKREIKNYFKNPIYWIGIIIIIIGIYNQLNPYLSIKYVDGKSILELDDNVIKSDADIMNGYITLSKEKQKEEWLNNIENSIVENWDMTKDEAEEIIEDVKKQNLSPFETSKYLEENYGFFDGYGTYRDAEIGKGTVEEINSYIEKNVEENNFSYYFARKLSDFTSLYFLFFSAIILSFLYLRDTKNDIYEILHTKPIKSSKYILGKAIGGFLPMIFILFLINIIFSILCYIHCNKENLPFNIFDIPYAVTIYTVPSLLIVIGIYTIIAMVFKNPLPSLPILIIATVYSNMGSYNELGEFNFWGRPFAILFRFPGRFFEIMIPNYIIFNQIFCIVASIIMLTVSIIIWKRRRA